ncbi:MAG TPA: hypothetical protein VGQ35_11590 [Dongiaceae bacterium]|nr:hypothetical protein [Dongiaceae bacterium]
MGSIFNIIGCSAALLCHFAANPTAHPKYRDLHNLLVNSLRDVPREIPLRNLRQLEGHCHTVTIDEDLPDDSTASSTIALFEDGKSLPRWHFRDAGKIAKDGLGRYLHVGRTIYFATSDNSSPLTNGRKYVAIHLLCSDAGTIRRLMSWKKTTQATGAARLFETLQILWTRHFGYAASSGNGPDVSLSDVRFAIDQEARMRLAARALSVRPVAGTAAQWDFEITALATADAPDDRWNVRGRIDLAPAAEALLPSLRIDGPGGFLLSFDRTAAGTIVAKLGKPDAIRPMLLAALGNEAGLDAWTGVVARLATAPLDDGGFGLALGQSEADTLARIFSDNAAVREYELTIGTAAGGRQAVLKRVAHGS